MNELFSQLDPRWSGIPLGNYGKYTLGSAGCLVSAAAGMLLANCVDVDPGRLNRWLARNNGFVSGCNVVFAAPGRLANLGCQVIDCADRSAPVALIKQVLAEGGHVLALVDFRPGGAIQQHWVRLLTVSDEDALVHDPWLPPGSGPYWLMARYGHPSWDGPARAIFRLALYTSPPVSALALGDSRERQEKLFVKQ